MAQDLTMSEITEIANGQREILVAVRGNGDALTAFAKRVDRVEDQQEAVQRTIGERLDTVSRELQNVVQSVSASTDRFNAILFTGTNPLAMRIDRLEQAIIPEGKGTVGKLDGRLVDLERNVERIIADTQKRMVQITDFRRQIILAFVGAVAIVIVGLLATKFGVSVPK